MEEIQAEDSPDIQETQAGQSISIRANPQSVATQRYSIESLLSDFPQIIKITEKVVYHTKNDYLEVKNIKVYSMQKEHRDALDLFDTKDFTQLFGNKATEVFNLLKNKRYVSNQNGKIRIRTLFKVATLDEFHLGIIRENEKKIFEGVSSLFVQRIKVKIKNGMYSEPIARLFYSKNNISLYAQDSGENAVVLRIGNKLIEVMFSGTPTPEMLELVQLKIELVEEELLKNNFNIISSFCSDATRWRNAKNKKAEFFDILGNFLDYTWTLLDLEECRLEIVTEEGLYSFAHGSLVCQFDYYGKSYLQRFMGEVIPPKVENPDRELSSPSMQLTINRETMEPIFINCYFKSRSIGNVSPQTNLLMHRFLQIFTETVAKVIDLIVPIFQTEEMEKDLKWRSFIDRYRLRSVDLGENIHKILSEALTLLKWFFEVQESVLYVPDPELARLLIMFRDLDPKQNHLYRIVTEPLTRAEVLRSNYVPVKLLQKLKEEMILFIRLPQEYHSEKEVNDTIDYLRDTELSILLKRTAAKMKLIFWDDLIFFLCTECLSASPTITMANIIEKWPVGFLHGGINPVQVFAHRLMEYFHLFFDLMSSIDGNLESGIISMRGSRDRLTGLYNRQTFNSKLESLYAKEESFGFIFMDMDSFKIYNDAVSHSFGDLLLIALAQFMIEISHNLVNIGTPLPGRFGGDEFCFALSGVNLDQFDQIAIEFFNKITKSALPVIFYLDDHHVSTGAMEINLISFLHRLIRPDVGGIRGVNSEFIEPNGCTPRERILRLYYHYFGDSEEMLTDKSLEDIINKEYSNSEEENIARQICSIIAKKILDNHIMENIEDVFNNLIFQFVYKQIKNCATNEVRQNMMDDLGGSIFEHQVFLRISCGVTHTEEDRLRSVSSLFKAADGRAYLAKHNGKNCVFGENNKKLC